MEDFDFKLGQPQTASCQFPVALVMIRIYQSALSPVHIEKQVAFKYKRNSVTAFTTARHFLCVLDSSCYFFFCDAGVVTSTVPTTVILFL